MACIQTEDPKEINWPREMKIMNKLAKAVPNYLFWDHARPTFKLPSLAWFLTKKGKKYLNEKWRDFNHKMKEPEAPPMLEEDKVGQDGEVGEKKILTISDFLKQKKTEE